MHTIINFQPFGNCSLLVHTGQVVILVQITTEWPGFNSKIGIVLCISCMPMMEHTEMFFFFFF